MAVWNLEQVGAVPDKKQKPKGVEPKDGPNDPIRQALLSIPRSERFTVWQMLPGHLHKFAYHIEAILEGQGAAARQSVALRDVLLVMAYREKCPEDGVAPSPNALAREVIQVLPAQEDADGNCRIWLAPSHSLASETARRQLVKSYKRERLSLLDDVLSLRMRQDLMDGLSVYHASNAGDEFAGSLIERDTGNSSMAALMKFFEGNSKTDRIMNGTEKDVAAFFRLVREAVRPQGMMMRLPWGKVI